MSELLDELALKKKAAIDNIAKAAPEIPGVVIVHELPLLNVVYMSPRGLNNLGLTPDALNSLGGDYNYLYFNKADAEDYIPKVFAMLERRDPNEIVTFFQQVRSSPTAPWTWHISTTRILLQDTDGTPVLAITVSQPIDPLHHVTSKVSRLLEENDFLRTNYARFNTLTKREVEVLTFMGQSKSTAEIAQILFVSTHTIESHRKNIRRKLNINTAYDQEQYIRAFDLASPKPVD